MRPIRPYKPAPKNASANRIRERYLHQLGLQRGGAPLSAPHFAQSNHVVVISGLPSLPEDRATTTEHVMESHDFSISKQSHHTGATPGSADAGSNDDMDSDSGSVHQIHRQAVSSSGDSVSHCSKSTLSLSPSQKEANEALTSMALAYPTTFRQNPPVKSNHLPNSSNNALPFPLSHSVPWRSKSLSKPASVLLDSADFRGNDQDSVSSMGTSTTCESSLTATMVSRDWGAAPHTTSTAVSVSSQGESPASVPGVYFQCGHPRLLGVNAPGIGGQCATSSLAHALNRFNIDSDCEASVASNSIVDDHNMMDEDDASFDDTASRASVTSHTSTGSTGNTKSASHSLRGRKKIGRTQRLMDRAAAHERILQIRSDQSQKMRASLVQSQRMGNPVTISGLSTVMAQEAQPAVIPGSGSSSQSSNQLVHVQHGEPSQALAQERHPLTSVIDLGRTPTASNCSDLRTLKAFRHPSLPVGIYMAPGNLQGPSTPAMAPLGFHPQLACGVPQPPPKLVGVTYPSTTSSASEQGYRSISNRLGGSQNFPEIESREVEDSISLQHMDHQATVDDVMEVAMTLSKLGGGRTGSIPRIR